MKKSKPASKQTIQKAHVPEDSKLMSLRRRMYDLHQDFANLSLVQKTERVQQSITLVEEFERTVAIPDQNFYTLSIQLWVSFCRNTPDHYHHVPTLSITLLHVLNSTKDIELPQTAGIYHFAITLLEGHCNRDIQMMLQTGAVQENMLEVSFEQVYAIFQQFLVNINHKKNSSLSETFQQYEIEIYNKFIYILVLAHTSNKLAVPELNEAWKGASLHILIKIFKQAETANIALKWTSYNHMVIALATTRNPNIDLLFHCFDKIKAVGFFELVTTANHQQSQITAINIHYAFCTVFFQGIQHILDYDQTQSSPHFTTKHLKKTLKIIAYLQAKNLLDTIIPAIFDIFARAPYHAKMDSLIRACFPGERLYQPELLVVIFKGLSRCRSLPSADLRYFFDYCVTHEFLPADTQETHSILTHLFKALANLAEPQASDIIAYLDTAIVLEHNNPKSFDRAIQSLTNLPPAVAEETLLSCFNKVRPLPCLANANRHAANIVSNMVFCLEDLSLSSDALLQAISDFIESSEQAFPNQVSYRFLRYLDRFPESCKQLADHAPQLYEMYDAYQQGIQTHSKMIDTWGCEEHHEPFSTFIAAILQYANRLISITGDEHYSPAEKLHHLQVLNTELAHLQALEPMSKRYDIVPHHYYERIQKELRSAVPNINFIQACVSDFRETVEIAQRKAQAQSEFLGLETIWTYITSKDIDKLEQANISLDRLIANLEAPHHYQYLVAKIHCLINLGKYDQAMVWLYRAKEACQNRNDRSLRISFALCCKKLGQFMTAIQLREQVRGELEQSKYTPAKIANLLELALCYRLAKGPEHAQSALAIYHELQSKKAPLTPIQTHEMSIHIADCHIILNEFSQAKAQLDAIPGGDSHPKVLLSYAWLYQVQKQYGRAKTIYLTILAGNNNTEATWRALFKQSHTLPSQERALVREHIHDQLENTTIQSKAFLNEKVMMLMHEKRYEQAFDVLNHMLKTWGKDESIYIGLAICHRHLHNVDVAITMLTEFPNYRENRKIVMQLIECYQLKQDTPKLLACFDILVMRFPTQTLGVYKAIRYYCQQGDIDQIQFAWKQCQLHCKESILLREIEKMVQPYVSEPILQTTVVSEVSMTMPPSFDPAILTRLDLEDIFATYEAQNEEHEMRELAFKNPRYIPDLLHLTRTPASSSLIKALDLAQTSKLTVFKDAPAVRSDFRPDKTKHVQIKNFVI